MLSLFRPKRIDLARPLHPHHWRALEYIRKQRQKPQMELIDFLGYWEVSRKDLARICNCSVSLVGRWFTHTESHIDPTSRHKELLAEAHQIFLKAAKRSVA